MQGVPIPRGTAGGRWRRPVARRKATLMETFVLRGIFPRHRHRAVRQPSRWLPGPHGQRRQLAALPVQPVLSRHQPGRRFGCPRGRRRLRLAETNVFDGLRFRRTWTGEQHRRGPKSFDARPLPVVIQLGMPALDVSDDLGVMGEGNIVERALPPPVPKQRLRQPASETVRRAEPQPELPIFVPEPHRFVVAARPLPVVLANQGRVGERIAFEQVVQVVFRQRVHIVPLAEHAAIGVDESQLRSRHRRNGFGNATGIEKIVGIERKHESATGGAHSRIARCRQPEVRLFEEDVGPGCGRADVIETVRPVGSIVNQDDFDSGVGLRPRRGDGVEKPWAGVVARDDDGNQVHAVLGKEAPETAIIRCGHRAMRAGRTGRRTALVRGCSPATSGHDANSRSQRPAATGSTTAALD